VTKRLLDASGGVISEFHYDHSSDLTTVKMVQDVEPIVENNKDLRSQGKGYTPSKDLRHVASIPLVIVEQWIKEDGVNFMTLPKHEKSVYLRRKLADPDNRAWRTSEGAM
jgi:hypothetical protein|tara:strand:- start:58 stop:387 length:330 start_codon:yes stop_codon:yes gene_type:complete